jgi:hypothetical protein
MEKVLKECERCHTTEGVETVIDPYMKDIYEAEEEITLCDECLTLRCEDI